MSLFGGGLFGNRGLWGGGLMNNTTTPGPIMPTPDGQLQRMQPQPMAANPLTALDAREQQVLSEADQQKAELQEMLTAARAQGVNPWPIVINTIAGMAQLGAGVASLSAGKSRGPDYTIGGLGLISQGVGSLAGTMAATGNQKDAIANQIQGLLDIGQRIDTGRTQALQQIESEREGIRGQALDLRREGRLAGDEPMAALGREELYALRGKKPPDTPALKAKAFENWSSYYAVANGFKDLMEADLPAQDKKEAMAAFEAQVLSRIEATQPDMAGVLRSYVTNSADTGKEARAAKLGGKGGSKNLQPMDQLLRWMSANPGTSLQDIQDKKIQPAYDYLRLTGKVLSASTKQAITATDVSTALNMVLDDLSKITFNREVSKGGQAAEAAYADLNAKALQALDLITGLRSNQAMLEIIRKKAEARAAAEKITVEEAIAALRRENPLYDNALRAMGAND